MTAPIIGSFEMVNVTEAKTSGGVGESEAELNTSQYKVLTIAKIANRNASGIWNYFGVAEKQNATANEQKQKAADRILCLVCFEKGTVHVYKQSTSSGNLWRHLHRKHGIPIPKDRAGSAAINVRANFEINDVKKAKKNLSFIDESTLFSAKLEVRDVSSDDHEEQYQDGAMSGESLRYDSDSFSKDIGSMLISEVSKRPALYEWNCKTITSTKKAKRDELWQEVYESLGKVIEVNRLQKMWKNIRDRYKKLKNLEQDGITDASSRYKYYDQLKFLESFDNQSHTRKSHMLPVSNDSNNSSDTELHPSFENTVDDTIEFAGSLVTHNDESPSKKSKFNDTDDEITPKLYETLQTSAFENTVSSYDVPPELETVASCSVMDQLSPKRDYPDEFDLFGRLIAEKLRKLPTSRVDDVEIKILQLIRREESITQ